VSRPNDSDNPSSPHDARLNANPRPATAIEHNSTRRINMSDNQAAEAKGRVKDPAGSSTRNRPVKNDRQADQARKTDKGNNLVDTLPGRGSE